MKSRDQRKRSTVGDMRQMWRQIRLMLDVACDEDELTWDVLCVDGLIAGMSVAVLAEGAVAVGAAVAPVRMRHCSRS